MNIDSKGVPKKVPKKVTKKVPKLKIIPMDTMDEII